MTALTPRPRVLLLLTLLFGLMPATTQAQDQPTGTLSVKSLPVGARVFVGPPDLESDEHPGGSFSEADLSEDSEYLRGESPLVFDLPAGDYQVGVTLKEITEEARAFAKENTTNTTPLGDVRVMLNGRWTSRVVGSDESMLIRMSDGEPILFAKIVKVTIEAGQILELEVSVIEL